MVHLYNNRRLLSTPTCYKQGDKLYAENLDNYQCVWHTPNYEGPGSVSDDTFPMTVSYVGYLELYSDANCNNYAMEIQCEDRGDGTPAPTGSPTPNPTKAPTTPIPTASPTTPMPTGSPTPNPTKAPTTPIPTASPTTPAPTSNPTSTPTASPTTPSPTSGAITGPACYFDNGKIYGRGLTNYGCGWHIPNYENWGYHIISATGTMEFPSTYVGELELYSDAECNNYATVLTCQQGLPGPTPTSAPTTPSPTASPTTPMPTSSPTTPAPTTIQTPSPTPDFPDTAYCYRTGGRKLTVINVGPYDCLHYTSHFKDGNDITGKDTFMKDYILTDEPPRVELYTGAIDIIGWSRSCVGTWVKTIPCHDLDDIQPVLPQGNKRAVYLWEHLFDNKPVNRIYEAITNDPVFNFNTIKIAMDDDMTPHRQLYNMLKQSHPNMEITLDISNNQLLDDFSKIDEQLDLMYTYFGDVLDDIPTISIDFEPHAHFNRKDKFTGEPLYKNPTWPEDNDYYLRIYIDLIKAIKEKLPDKRYCIATPTFFPAWTIFELYDLSDCIYIMYYETFNSGKDEQVRDIHSVYISKESYIILQSVDFPDYNALLSEFDRISTMSTITNLGLLDLEKRIDFLDA